MQSFGLWLLDGLMCHFVDMLVFSPPFLITHFVFWAGFTIEYSSGWVGGRITNLVFQGEEG
jgi:hypothetical protein